MNATLRHPFLPSKSVQAFLLLCWMLTKCWNQFDHNALGINDKLADRKSPDVQLFESAEFDRRRQHAFCCLYCDWGREADSQRHTRWPISMRMPTDGSIALQTCPHCIRAVLENMTAFWALVTPFTVQGTKKDPNLNNSSEFQYGCGSELKSRNYVGLSLSFDLPCHLGTWF